MRSKKKTPRKSSTTLCRLGVADFCPSKLWRIRGVCFVYGMIHTGTLPLFANEQVDFKYPVDFFGNKVLSDGDVDAGDGGALCVASRGEVSFQDFSYFTENEAESGGQGGAVANFGYLLFERASYLASNTAKGDP